MISSISSSNSLYQSLMTQMRQRMYNSMDTDGNGSVSKNELSSMMSGTSTTLDVDALFSQIDTDGDGAITTNEFDSAMNTMGYPPSPFGEMSSDDVAQQLFTTSDTNGDGQLDTDELSAMAATGPEGGPSADELIGKLDTDGDGTLSEAEFAAGAPQGGNPRAGVSSMTSSDETFDALDTNKDGFISEAEWEAGTTSASSATETSNDKLFATLLENLHSTSTSGNDNSTDSTTSKVAELLAAIQSYMKFDTNSYSLNDSRSLFGSDVYA